MFSKAGQHVTGLWCCTWGRGLRGNSAGCSALFHFQSLPPSPTSKLGPSGAGSPAGWCVYVLRPRGSLQRTVLWGWEFLLLPQPPQVFSVRGFEALFPCARTLGCAVCLSPVVPPGLSTHKCGTACTASHCLACPRPPAAALLQVFSVPAAIFAPPTSLDDCSFFNSLVVRPSYRSIFWQIWLFFIFKFVVVLLVVWGGKVYLPTPPSWSEVQKREIYYMIFQNLGMDWTNWPLDGWSRMWHSFPVGLEHPASGLPSSWSLTRE